MNKKQFHNIDKRALRHTEKNLLRNSHVDPDTLPDKDVTLGKVCRRGWGSGIVKK